MAGRKKIKTGKKVPPPELSAARAELVRDAGGYDWGWPSVSLVSANPELVQLLAEAGFVGCGYGLMSPEGPPFLALVGDKLPEMRSALALLKNWVDAIGPNAIQAEIMFDGSGYIFSISQEPRLLRWRLVGIDSANEPIVISLSVNKKLDTRHPFLEDLAKYATSPIAPLYLTVAETPPSMRGGGQGMSLSGFQPLMGEAIFLPGIDVYRTADERPKSSMIRDRSDKVRESELSAYNPKNKPEDISANRERRLKATMPKTIHSLRNLEDAQLFLNDLATEGCLSWQVEQAICNLKLPNQLTYQPKSYAKKLAMVEQLRRELIEPASVPVELGSLDRDQALKQIDLDLAFLLRRLEPDREPPREFGKKQARLRKLGYA